MEEGTVIDVSHRDKADIYIAKFANGRVKSENAERMSFTAFKGKDKFGQKDKKAGGKRILVCDTDDLRYSGSNEDSSAPLNTGMCKHMIAAYNTKTHKVRLFDIQMIHMKPDFVTPDEEKYEDETDLTRMEKVDNLTNAFGGLKKRRAMESRIRNQIRGDSLNKALTSVVDDVMKRPDVEELVAKQQTESARADIPPHDENATEPSEVYKLEDIISSDLMSALLGPAQEFISSTKESLQEWSFLPNFIFNHLSILPMEANARARKAQTLKYLYYMMVLYKKNSRELQGKGLFEDEVPQAVRKEMLNQFIVESRNPQGRMCRAIPARLKDKLLSYILVIAMILDNFHLEFSALMMDLGLNKNRLLTVFNSLGCRVNFKSSVTQAEAANVATLPIPFKIHVNEPKRSKKKR